MLFGGWELVTQTNIREFVPLKEGQNCLHLVQALYSPEATFLRLTTCSEHEAA